MDRSTPQTTHTTPAQALGDVVCGVDGGRRDTVAVEQALRLADGSTLTFVAVAHVVGKGPNAQAAMGDVRAEHTLDRATRMAHEHGVQAESRLVHGADAAEALMREADGAGVLVVGAPLHGRIGGIAEGATSARLAHRATLPVLIAREAKDAAPFPQRVLLATDGSTGSHRAAELTVAIAAAHGAEVTMVHAGDSSDAERRRMVEQAARVSDVTRVEPVWLEPGKHPVDGICHCATWSKASLVVVGARGVGGVRALGSVSERVAHEAPCSVLIARG